MSNLVFPTLSGIKWDVAKEPAFSTKIQKSISGKETRLAFMSSPMYTFKMTYEFLRDGAKTELKTLLGFFLARQGSYDSFLYTDTSDNSVTAASFGTGDGSTKTFQLTRPYGPTGAQFYETVQNLNGTPSLYSDGVLLTSGYTISSTGLVTFTTAPANGKALTWTGSYYYRVRFNNDASEFNQFMQDLWDLKKCELYGSLANKI